MTITISNGVSSTGITNKWIIVYDDNKCYVSSKNNNQETISKKTIEEFDTEEEMLSRLIELGLEPVEVLQDESI